MTDLTLCPFCREPIQRDAQKCKYCLEFVSTKNRTAVKSEGHEKLKAVLEFAGKFIIPLTILVVIFLFKPTFTSLLTKTESANFLGVAITFSKTTGFQGDLSPFALYHLIGSADGGGTRYEGYRVKYIDELVDKRLVSIEVEKRKDGSKEMQGTWAIIKPTDNGKAFLRDIGIAE